MDPKSRVIAGPNSVDGLICRVVDVGNDVATTEELRGASWVPSKESIRDVLRGIPVKPEVLIAAGVSVEDAAGVASPEQAANEKNSPNRKIPLDE